MNRSYHHVDDLLGEFSYAFKSLCDHYNFEPEEICKLKYAEMIETILSDKTLARHVKSIPFLIDIPEQMCPARANDNFLSMEMSPAPGEDEYDKHAHGIAEYKIRRDHTKPWAEPGNQLTFWQWSGFREQYPLGSWIYFVKKEDLRSFYRAVLTLRHRVTEDVDVPVLPGNMLAEIFRNTLGFLQEGRERREEYKKARIPYRRGLLLCGIPGCGKCTNVNTWVFTSEGMKRIGDFLTTEGPDEASSCEVKIHGVNGRESTEQIYNGGYQNTKVISSRFGFQLEATPNHKIVVSDGEDLAWKRIDEIKEGDYVAIPRGMHLFGSETYLGYAQASPSNHKPNTRLPNEMTEDLAYFLGLLTGEGGLTIKNRIVFTTNELLEVYMDLAAKLFNVKPAVREGSTPGTHECTIQSVQIKSFLSLLGLTSASSCNKEVPHAILSSPEMMVRNYLRGLFDTDGWADTTGRIGYDSCSEKLCESVHLLLTNFGIISSRREKPNRNSGAWSIDINGEQAKKFYETIGFGLPRKQNRSDNLSQNFNTNFDVVPYSGSAVTSLLKEGGPFPHKIHAEFHRYKSEDQKMSTHKALRLSSLLHKPQGWVSNNPARSLWRGSRSLGDGGLLLLRPDIFWDKVVGVKESHAHVADFYVPESHSFAAGGFMNHNTMTCKWLRQLCIVRGFAYRIVTMEEYRNAMSRGQSRGLFRLPKGSPGIIFFDDMDIFVKDRNNGVTELQTFLTEMDGIRPTEGVVYVFTTNFVKELDAAFVRPGRIDLYLPFRAPTKNLRKRFISEKFGEVLLKDIDVEKMTERTDEYSFAEIEEIRKLLTMDNLRGKEISVDKTFKVFELHRKEFQERTELGFGAKMDDGDDYYNDDNDLPLDLDALLKSL